jgi:hypothetical protein
MAGKSAYSSKMTCSLVPTRSPWLAASLVGTGTAINISFYHVYVVNSGRTFVPADRYICIKARRHDGEK